MQAAVTSCTASPYVSDLGLKRNPALLGLLYEIHDATFLSDLQQISNMSMGCIGYRDRVQAGRMLPYNTQDAKTGWSLMATGCSHLLQMAALNSPAVPSFCFRPAFPQKL